MHVIYFCSLALKIWLSLITGQENGLAGNTGMDYGMDYGMGKSKCSVMCHGLYSLVPACFWQSGARD